MADDSIVYTINLIIGAILSGVMSRQRLVESSGRSLPPWILAAWTLTAADLLFILRGEWPGYVPRMLPTLTVTAGHVMLLVAARRTAGRSTAPAAIAGIVSFHVAVLSLFAFFPHVAAWRSVTNSTLWGALSVLTALSLRAAEPSVRRAMNPSAFVLAAQGGFHLLRVVFAARAALQPTGGSVAPLVQLFGDLEVSLFMVALFVSVLVAFLQLSNQELRSARDSVHELSSMLPLCAWCSKVRDDDGYWRRIEEYLTRHRISVTHGMCESCASEHMGEEAERRLAAASPDKAGGRKRRVAGKVPPPSP